MTFLDRGYYRNNWQNGISILGRPRARQSESSSWNRIGPHYFETLGTRVVRGRVEDRNGAYTDYTTSIVVNNVPPVVTLPDFARGAPFASASLSASGRVQVSKNG